MNCDCLYKEVIENLKIIITKINDENQKLKIKVEILESNINAVKQNISEMKESMKEIRDKMDKVTHTNMAILGGVLIAIIGSIANFFIK